MKHYDMTVHEEHKGERIDKYLTAVEADWSRTQVQQWIKEDRVLVNGNAVKANYKVQEGDAVSVAGPEPEPLDVMAEPDGSVIFIMRTRMYWSSTSRAGMVVHPAPGHLTGTLVNGLMAHCDDLSGINGVMRPGIVHRIDKDTSGLLMVAKNDMAHESLVNQLVNKTVTRKYTALVHGVIPHDHGTIDAPIGRDKKDRQSMTVTRENGKHAVTHFEVIERFDDFTVS